MRGLSAEVRVNDAVLVYCALDKPNKVNVNPWTIFLSRCTLCEMEIEESRIIKRRTLQWSVADTEGGGG